VHASDSKKKLECFLNWSALYAGINLRPDESYLSDTLTLENLQFFTYSKNDKTSVDLYLPEKTS
jgi:hypothetical protein